MERSGEEQEVEEKTEETLGERNIRVLAELEARADAGEDLEAYVKMTDLQEQLTVRDRLLARTRRKTVTTELDVLDDDEKVIDTIEIETRMMTTSERVRATNYLEKLKAFAPKEGVDMSDRSFGPYNEIMSGFSELLAEIVVTPGLRDYFLNGEATEDILMGVATNALVSSVESTGDEVERFRKK